MSLETLKPNSELVSPGCPIITLAGREWFVPVLAMRQNRIVVPALMRLLPVLGAIESSPTALSADALESLITIAHAALTRAYPSLTMEDFLDLTISPLELIAAINIIGRQAGALKEKAAAPDEQKGEANG